jgi:hypothetical protein
MKVIPQLTQGSPEWLAMRKGRPTASRFSDIVTAAKGELSKSAKGYAHELIGECFVPDYEYGQPTWSMQRGTTLEPDARMHFATQQASSGQEIREVGFVLSDDGVCGCSPDCLIWDAAKGAYVAGVEIKCPSPKVHIGWLLDGALPDEHKQQVHGSMAVTGLSVWHFVSYFPGLPIFHIVIHRDEYTAKVVTALAAFVGDYKKLLATAKDKFAAAVLTTPQNTTTQ